MHHQYFHGDRAVVPARALEDVFAEMQEASSVEARWIAVNMPPMSINHKPKTDFERRAAETLADGQEQFEGVENGYYRRAGAIPLAGECVSCHAGFFKPPSKKPKFAGLVISIPVDGKGKESSMVVSPSAATDDHVESGEGRIFALRETTFQVSTILGTLPVATDDDGHHTKELRTSGCIL